MKKNNKDGTLGLGQYLTVLNKNMNLLKCVMLALGWVRDLREGEMIETPTYTRKFLEFDYLDDEDVFRISEAVNHVIRTIGNYTFIVAQDQENLKRIIPVKV